MAFYDWTCDRISQLLGLRRQGLTARQIGHTIGVSRNSVIGKLSRLGESRPGTQRKNGELGGRLVKNRKLPHYNRRFEKTPPGLKRPGTFPAEMPALRSSVPVTFTDLKSYHCRWPLGDPRMFEFRFCGAEAAPASSYCPHHYEASIRRQGDDKD